MRPPEQKNRGTTVAVALIVVGWIAICCGCGGFFTAAVMEADSDDPYEDYDYGEIQLDTGA